MHIIWGTAGSLTVKLLNVPQGVATTADRIWDGDNGLSGTDSGILILAPHAEQQSALPAYATGTTYFFPQLGQAISISDGVILSFLQRT
jgi:hypothetical protein